MTNMDNHDNDLQQDPEHAEDPGEGMSAKEKVTNPEHAEDTNEGLSINENVTDQNVDESAVEKDIEEQSMEATSAETDEIDQEVQDISAESDRDVSEDEIDDTDKTWDDVEETQDEDDVSPDSLPGPGLPTIVWHPTEDTHIASSHSLLVLNKTFTEEQKTRLVEMLMGTPYLPPVLPFISESFANKTAPVPDFVFLYMHNAILKAVVRGAYNVTVFSHDQKDMTVSGKGFFLWEEQHFPHPSHVVIGDTAELPAQVAQEVTSSFLADTPPVQQAVSPIQTDTPPAQQAISPIQTDTPPAQVTQQTTLQADGVPADGAQYARTQNDGLKQSTTQTDGLKQTATQIDDLPADGSKQVVAQTQAENVADDQTLGPDHDILNRTFVEELDDDYNDMTDHDDDDFTGTDSEHWGEQEDIQHASHQQVSQADQQNVQQTSHQQTSQEAIQQEAKQKNGADKQVVQPESPQQGNARSSQQGHAQSSQQGHAQSSQQGHAQSSQQGRAQSSQQDGSMPAEDSVSLLDITPPWEMKAPSPQHVNPDINDGFTRASNTDDKIQELLHGFDSSFAKSAAGGADESGASSEFGEHMLGTLCPSGHQNAPQASECRICDAPLSGKHEFMWVKNRGKLYCSNGQTYDIDKHTIVGRRPKSRGDAPAQLVFVQSPLREISSTHLEIEIQGWSVMAIDRSSNGTAITRPGQRPVALVTNTPRPLRSGDVLDIGEGFTLTFQEIA